MQFNNTASLPFTDDLLDAHLPACLHLASSESGVAYFALNHGDYEMHLSSDFERALAAVTARCTLEEGYELNIEQLALLANMYERSVFNALRDESGESVYELNEEQAREWLSRRRGFIPTKYYNSLSEEQRLKNITSFFELKELIAWKAGALDLKEKAVNEIKIALGSLYDMPDDELPEKLLLLAELLQWNPSWFIKTVMELRNKFKIIEMKSELNAEVDRALNRLGLSKAFSDSPESVDESAFATAENIRALIDNTPGIRRHLKDKGGNAKIEVYIADNGRAIAHEYNLKQQSLWVQSAGLHPSSIEVRRTDEPSHRHSGLQKYPELKQAGLIRFQPETMEQVKLALDAVSGAKPIETNEEEGEEK